MKRISKYLGTAAALLVILINSAPAFAAATSSGLSITPRKNAIIEPGKTVNDKLTITNLNKSADLQVTLKVIDFTFMDNTGTPKLLLADNAAQTSWSIKPFITLPKNVVVPAGQTRSVDYSLKIPANQGAGSYYGAIQYATGASEGGQVSLSASGVSLFFISVPGVVKEKLTIKQFGAYRTSDDKVSGKYLTIANTVPQEMAYSLQNDGNVAESPVATIAIKYMFGNKVINIENANTSGSLALIGQNRLFTSCIEGEVKQIEVAGSTTNTKVCKKVSMMPGRYAAKLDVFYGQNGNNTNETTAEASFWYLPGWFLGAVAAGLLIIAGLIFFIVKKLRKATRRR